MRKIYVFLSFIGIVIIMVNYTIYRDQYETQKQLKQYILSQQIKISAEQIKNIEQQFNHDINNIILPEEILELFSNTDIEEDKLGKLEFFYSKYNTLIKNIFIYDQDKNVLNLFIDTDNNFIADRYTAQRQRTLARKINVSVSDNDYRFLLPVSKDDIIVGNVVITIDILKYISSVLNKYHIQNLTWQWIIDLENNEVNFTDSLIPSNISDINEINETLIQNKSGNIEHYATLDNKEISLYSVFYPVKIFNFNFGIVISLNNKEIFTDLIQQGILAGLISFLLYILAVIFIIIYSYKRSVLFKSIQIDKVNIESIMDELPIGVMIMDSDQKIHIINNTAREMLLFKPEDELVGKDISDRFMFSKNFSPDESQRSAYDSNQFILYQKEGNEVIIYKKEVPYTINQQEFALAAFIDVTPIEKSRKYEAAANTAKSEFLARMSHEIRTPMNGIIGMTEALDLQNLTPQQKEYVEIVKKSADLLLNIINDILDISKIEAGKMQLEEIPFKLREEVKLSLDIFRPIVEEKKLKLISRIDENVPDNIIGDPFRLRQVLSNLVSNSVKFTHEGEIIVGVKVEEEYSGNLTLLFSVEDTGVGIPKEKIESIFNSFTQVESSTSRKYGGSGLGTTISKQLVTLMHGEIWVDSPSSISSNSKYPGSKFSFTIEVFSNEKLNKNINYQNINKFNEIQSLIITKDKTRKKVFYRLLDRLAINYEILEYKNEDIEELKSYLNSNKEKLHLIYLIDEPNFEGIKIAHRLKKAKITKYYTFFMLSSNHKQENYIQTKLAGIDYYLIEPFENKDFIVLLHEIFPSIAESDYLTDRKIRPDLSILVAEDNLINQKVAETIFGHLGLTIDIAKNGIEALEKIDKNTYDIVFMDLLMPEKDGMQTTIDIRGMGFQMPIIAMTASTNKKSKVEALSAGMNDYIIKPVKIEAIQKVLLKWFS
ncbi:MAG: response regulator [Bacteroidales bacterium]|nr:response regulator [Bacteroidales bacterium]